MWSEASGTATVHRQHEPEKDLSLVSELKPQQVFTNRNPIVNHEEQFNDWDSSNLVSSYKRDVADAGLRLIGFVVTGQCERCNALQRTLACKTQV